MIPSPMMTWALAQGRTSDLLREAEQARLVKLAVASQPRTAGLMERLLHRLPRAYRVTVLQQPAGDALPTPDFSRQSACVTC